MQEIFANGKRQAENGIYSVPLQSRWPEISMVYQEGWHEIALKSSSKTVANDMVALKEKADHLLD